MEELHGMSTFQREKRGGEKKKVQEDATQVTSLTEQRKQ